MNHKYTKEQIAEVLTASAGKVSIAAEKLGSCRQTIYDSLKRYPELEVILEDARVKLIDTAEIALQHAVLKGEAWAVCFALKTVGKKRGYVERSELTIDGTEVRIVERIVAARATLAAPNGNGHANGNGNGNGHANGNGNGSAPGAGRLPG